MTAASPASTGMSLKSAPSIKLRILPPARKARPPPNSEPIWKTLIEVAGSRVEDRWFTSLRQAAVSGLCASKLNKAALDLLASVSDDPNPSIRAMAVTAISRQDAKRAAKGAEAAPARAGDKAGAGPADPASKEAAAPPAKPQLDLRYLLFHDCYHVGQIMYIRALLGEGPLER